MRHFSNLAPFLLSLLLFCGSAKESLSQKKVSNNDIEKLKKLEYDWLIAEFKMDTATIALMMDEKFMAIGLSRITNKQQELNGMYENISQRLKNGHVVDSLYLDDIHIQIHDKTAIVTYVSVTKGRIKEVPFENRRTRMYDVWIKRNGQWKAVSSQVSPIRQVI